MKEELNIFSNIIYEEKPIKDCTQEDFDKTVKIGNTTYGTKFTNKKTLLIPISKKI